MTHHKELKEIYSRPLNCEREDDLFRDKNYQSKKTPV